MGGEKRGTKKGGYVGGFLHLFDWKSKSRTRKKLFASKSDLHEQSKVKKGADGSLPNSRFYLTDDDDETLMGASVKGSEYSCASSMTDEDGYQNKPPGVVARLMGLDSLPISYFGESFTTTPFIIGSQSATDHHRQTLSIQKAVDIKPQIVMMNSPIKKFQTEILPPKSAKPIPVTQNKLLSPIKSPGFVLLKDASDIMEAAAKIIDPGLQASSSASKSKPRLIGSSSVPLKVKDLKEKAEGVQKPSRFPKGQCRSRSSSDDLKDGVAVNNKGKPISVAVQAKVTSSDDFNDGVCINNKGKPTSLAVQAKLTSSDDLKDGVGVNNSKGKSISLAVQAKVNVQKREGLSQNAIRCTSVQKDPTIKTQQKKPSTNSSSTALRQNNQKQNLLVDKENLPSKPLPKVQVRRTKSVDSSPSRHITSSKNIDKSKVNDHGSKSPSRKNRLKEGIFHQDKNDRQISLKSADNKGKGVDVVSFTFKSPISRSMANDKLRQASQKSVNGGGGDGLSAFLEQKLKEFTQIVNSNGNHSSSSSSSSTISQDSVSDLESVTTTQISFDSMNQKSAQSRSTRHQHQQPQIKEEMNSEASTIQGKDHPSPISVLESSNQTETCDSSESTTTTTTSSDTDSSASRTITPTISGWELEYVKEILSESDMESMFQDYAIGRSQHFVNPQLYHQIESTQGGGDVGKQRRKVLFDFVNESMGLRCRQYTRGECRYEKGMMRRKEWFAEEIYEEMEGWRESGDCMVDDLVKKDMSRQNGKWVEFDVEVFELGVKIEGRIIASLINEVVADILRRP